MEWCTVIKKNKINLKYKSEKKKILKRNKIII
jgi:hypothetical protein